MKLSLKSNFRDFYDFAFDKQGEVFERLDNAGISRREMFTYFNELDLKTPVHGTVRDVVACLQESFDEQGRATQDLFLEHLVDLVVYLDEYQHAGEGKVKLSAKAALEAYPDHYCSEYIPATASGTGESLRYLQVGIRKWWIRYWSENDWRSNAGEGDWEVLCEEKRGYHPRIKYPMFAIDFVRAGKHLCAIDFNVAPGLGPLNGIVSPWDIVALVKRHIMGEKQ